MDNYSTDIETTDASNIDDDYECDIDTTKEACINILNT